MHAFQPCPVHCAMNAREAKGLANVRESLKRGTLMIKVTYRKTYTDGFYKGTTRLAIECVAFRLIGRMREEARRGIEWNEYRYNRYTISEISLETPQALILRYASR